MADRILIVGVGGPTCSGKTTLAKHLLRILHPDPSTLIPLTSETAASPSSSSPTGRTNAFIIHQDDFAPPEENVPWNEQHQVKDWDTPHGSIDFKRMASTLKHVRAHGALPQEFKSHDHLNSQPELPIPEAQIARWRERFLCNDSPSDGRIIYVLADGFLLYYSREVLRDLDVRLFLRVRKDTLKKRREERHGYATAEGTLWKDPPNYFENIVWPAYVLAHSGMFEQGDIERGRPKASPENASRSPDGGPVPHLTVLEADERGVSMEQLVERACEEIWRAVTDSRTIAA